MSIFSSKANRRFNVLHIFVLVVVFIITAMFPGSAIKSANAAGGGITVEITVDGIPIGTEALVTFLKIVEDVPYEVTKSTTNHVVTFATTFGGECTVTGGSIPGYNPPDSITIPLTKIKGQFVIRRTLTYVAEDIKVENINVSPSTLQILKDFNGILTADIIPDNAAVQAVYWTTDDSSIATVTEGVVSGISMGSTKINATITDGPVYSDSCNVSVFEITGVVAITPIPASPGDIIQLPANVSAYVTDGEVTDTWNEIPIESWTCASGVVLNNTVTFEAIGDYTVKGSIIGTEMEAIITVNVTGTLIIQPESVTLSPASITEIHPTDLYPTILTISSVYPEGADLSDIYWTSSDPTIATVVKTGLLTAEVTAVNNGYTAIQVYRNDGQFLGSCPVTVSTDETLTDPVYIQATDINGVALDQFPDKNSIYITCYNLDTHPGEYAIRVSEKSSDPILGENLIDGTNDIVINEGQSTYMFKLVDYVDFEPSTSFSKSNFVSMSRFNDFPSGDYEEDGTAQTLTDNFKVTSPVPTGYINVDIRQYDQFGEVSTLLHPNLIGTDVILGREIKDQTVEETSYEDYLNPAWYEGAPSTIPKYTDEAKLIGYVNDDDINGDYEVHWLEPKEPLKIGGYVLLIEVPEVSGGYFETNLNDPDPNNEEELVKEVHITRNTVVYKTIIFNFNGTP